MYETYLSAMKRSEEAIAEGKRSIELDPLFILYRAAAARPYYNARRYPEAIAQAKQALAEDSHSAVPVSGSAWPMNNLQATRGDSRA